ncbi:MAG TPA: N-acetylmuramoyl-L-alanine amidase [bacterium]
MKNIFFKHVLVLALVVLSASTAIGKPLVALDAGHGGSDSGVKAGSEVEKDWNFRIVQALQKALGDVGIDVVTIRKRDETLTGEKRAEMANSSGALAVLVVHADREWTETQKGPLLVVEPPTRADALSAGEIQKWGFVTIPQYHSSLKLARSIAESLGMGTELSSLSDSRGLPGESSAPQGRVFCMPHQNLRYLTLPSVVLTPLFLTSASDLKKFSKAEDLADFAAKVARGTANFLQVSQ